MSPHLRAFFRFLPVALTIGGGGLLFYVDPKIMIGVFILLIAESFHRVNKDIEL